MALGISRSLCLLALLASTTVCGAAKPQGSDTQAPLRLFQSKELYEHYVPHMTLSEEELGRRLIVVGDPHASYNHLWSLLNKLNYDPTADRLIVTGDLTTKGPLDGSLRILDDFARLNVTAVRGNHDQQVIQWRGWIENALSKKKGAAWLAKQERDEEDDVKVYKKKWKKIPGDWKFMDKHYKVARAMSPEEAAYIRTLPTVIHIPTHHAFVVHAGILASDPREPLSAEQQPLARMPELKHDDGRHDDEEATRLMRVVQERGILYEIEQNRDHWNLQNIRSITEDGDVTKDMDVGMPWSDHWNHVMRRCEGFDDFEEEEVAMSIKLPCHPSTVIYGHAATRGLEPKRWTVGLDSGCTYGRRLTALVVGSIPGEDNSLISDGEIPFGDNGTATLVSVSCGEEGDEDEDGEDN